MLTQSKETLQKHIRTHSEHAAEDIAAIAMLECFLRSGGRINTNFSKNDKWPNHDGTFELVPDPDVSRRPAQCFYVQVKGTHNYSEKNGIIKYSLQSLAFPAFVAQNVTLDPCILFVVLNPDVRTGERIFWKYVSVEWINSIDFSKNSTTVCFSTEDEIINTDESVRNFAQKLELIANHHSFIKKLNDIEFSEKDIYKIIDTYNEQIIESIDSMCILNQSRDGISQTIFPKLSELCKAVLLLNSLKHGNQTPNLRLAWEQALMDINTKYLAIFLKGLNYIDNRIPEEGQSERILLKYYNFLWQMRYFLKNKFNRSILNNLEKFPSKTDALDSQYYTLVASAIASVPLKKQSLSKSRFYIVKMTPFFVEGERYYEITLQLAGIFATKYNRITAYTKENISSNYTIQIGYFNVPISLWGVNTNIKVITNWHVSIEPSSINKLGEILKLDTRISSKYNEYSSLMNFLTSSGINFVDLIDLNELQFPKIIDTIFKNTRTTHIKKILLKCREEFSMNSKNPGKNVIRYLLLNLREETILNVMPKSAGSMFKCDNLYLSSRCVPFDKNPFIANLVGSNTSKEDNIRKIADITGTGNLNVIRPYLNIRRKINTTGEIFFDMSTITNKQEIEAFNSQLDNWERRNGYRINVYDDIVSIDSYETTTVYILEKLLKYSKMGNKGQREFNQKFLKDWDKIITDNLKKVALQNVFVNSRLLLIYGAAGTGKTTLINYISNLMGNLRKLFLTKTHTAKQNLQRRVENPGPNADFVSIDSFTKKVQLPDYDVIFIDECSTIGNRIMFEFLKKLSKDTFLVLAGDIYQIESIDFGNWFFYAKTIINTPGANVELLNTWRTEDETLISLWDEVRKRGPLITEKLAIDGPFSDDINEKIFLTQENDEVVLCLNYDGKFGLNNMNNYFQNKNQCGEAIAWNEWTYKIGDPILFNESKRFNILYNNLKGKIVEIKKTDTFIEFTIDVAINLTEKSCHDNDIEFISANEGSTRIRFSVFSHNHTSDEENDDLRMKSVIPFQLAYAVSIHKAQGLEYDSVKVVIPTSSSERITHGIFYTAITRAKKKLKIYWSSETMNEIVGNLSADKLSQKSLDIIKTRLNV